MSQTGDPLALASAICKAARAESTSAGLALAGMAGNGVPARLELLAHGPIKPSRGAAPPRER